MKNIGKAWFYVGEGRRGLSESFSMSSSLRVFFFNCLGPKLAPQLELVCGALLSHSHLMENICCRAF